MLINIKLTIMKLKLILSAFLLVASLGAFAQEESKKTSRQNVKSKEQTETTDEIGRAQV